MEHRFTVPKVQEINGGRPRPPVPAPGPRTQRELVLASLLHRPERKR